MLLVYLSRATNTSTWRHLCTQCVQSQVHCPRVVSLVFLLLHIQRTQGCWQCRQRQTGQRSVCNLIKKPLSVQPPIGVARRLGTTQVLHVCGLLVASVCQALGSHCAVLLCLHGDAALSPFTLAKSWAHARIYDEQMVCLWCGYGCRTAAVMM